jgi:hypothetical protein
MVNKKEKDKKFEGSPTELLMGAEAAPDHPSGTEFCIWCENYEAEEGETIYQDETMDYDFANYTEYKCGYCGAEFILGTATISIQKLRKAGDPKKHIDGPEAAEIQAVLGAAIAKNMEED